MPTYYVPTYTTQIYVAELSGSTFIANPMEWNGPHITANKLHSGMKNRLTKDYIF